MEQTTTLSKGTIISATFLVAGTCIGGGMLALPVVTGISGFFPSIIMMVICWLAMTFSALFLVEASLWMREGEFLISMASRLLGPFAKMISWCVYLFICYASLVAYTAGCGAQFTASLNNYFNLDLSRDVGCLIFISIFGFVTYLGSRLVGRVNSILFVAMMIAFALILGMGISEVDHSLLTHRHWNTSIMAIPIFLTSFSFQTMVPSLTPYLKRHPVGLRWAVIGGTTLTFLVYFIWQWLMLGIVPVEGEHGLKAALEQGIPSIQFLKQHVEGAHIAAIGEFFAFFALLTSFLGTVFGLFDFLSDGLNITEKKGLESYALHY